MRCKQCLLPEQAPGADLDENRVCRFCREYQPHDLENTEALRRAREANLEQAIRACRERRDAREYDCLVPLSGGKDSIYLLYKLKVEYGLRVLAHTTDISIGEVAWDNIHRAIAELDIEHIVYRPSMEFYAKLFRFLLMNQEARGAVHTVSYVYAPLFEGNALKVATDKGIPLVMAGYSPGQPDENRMAYEFPRLAIADVDWTPPAVKESGLFDDSDLARFWNPHRYPAGTKFPRYLAPFHAWPYSQENVMKKVVELGLIRSSKHASPIFSNYPINWLLMYSDLKNLGYNPYAPEFSALIREGKASLRYWSIAGPVVNLLIRNKIYLGREVEKHMRWLKLKDEDLVINRPSGKDWPDHVYEDWRKVAVSIPEGQP